MRENNKSNDSPILHYLDFRRTQKPRLHQLHCLHTAICNQGERGYGNPGQSLSAGSAPQENRLQRRHNLKPLENPAEATRQNPFRSWALRKTPRKFYTMAQNPWLQKIQTARLWDWALCRHRLPLGSLHSRPACPRAEQVAEERAHAGELPPPEHLTEHEERTVVYVSSITAGFLAQPRAVSVRSG